MPNLGIHKRADWNLENQDTSDAHYVRNKPRRLTDFANDLNLSTVAYTGSYSDLFNKPVLSRVAATGNYADLLSKPPLALVATSGNYTDLGSRPPGTLCYPSATAVTSGTGFPVKDWVSGIWNSTSGSAGNGSTLITFPHNCRSLQDNETYIPFAQPLVFGQYSFIVNVTAINNTTMTVNVLKFNSGSGAAENGIFGSTYSTNNIKIMYMVMIARSA